MRQANQMLEIAIQTAVKLKDTVTHTATLAHLVRARRGDAYPSSALSLPPQLQLQCRFRSGGLNSSQTFSDSLTAAEAAAAAEAAVEEEEPENSSRHV